LLENIAVKTTVQRTAVLDNRRRKTFNFDAGGGVGAGASGMGKGWAAARRVVERDLRGVKRET
jgi:hypothetical protein